MDETVIDWQKIYRTADQLVTRKIADETVIVPITGDLANMQRIFTMNEVGACIWHYIDGYRTLAEIRHAVLEEYEVAEDQLDSDIREFIEQLRSAGLLIEMEC